MKKQLLKIANIFIVANMIFLNTGVNAIFTLTKACTVRQKIKLFFKREKNNEEKIEYKYLAEQLCTCFKLPSPGSDKELTFNTPFGDVKFNIMAKGDIFISLPGINKYVEIAKALDEILTEEGRKQLAGIILEYLQTEANTNYRKKTVIGYKFKQSKFFDVIDEESKSCFSEELWQLNEQVKEIRASGLDIKKDLRTVKDKEEKEKIKNAREIVNNYNKKIGDAKGATTALCAILMISEPRRCRSYDGGKHERALMRDILNSGMKYTDAFEKFLPSIKGGATLAYEYSTDVYNEKELLESDNYSEEEEIIYDLEELFNNVATKK